MFITTANVLDTIPDALHDRMEVIEFPGYTENEKIEIAKRFLIPRQIDANGLSAATLKFPEAILHKLIRQYTYEAGVRNLEREIGSLCRKATRRLAENKRPIKKITPKTIERYLGPPSVLEDRLEKEDTVGVAMGLAWTQNGGDLLPVEVALTPGKGNVTLTGQLGDVMQESAQAAMTYLRSQAHLWDIDEDTFEKKDVHIHLPEAGIPKDGPSGGITIAVALFSAYTEYPVRRNVAFTGEITLRGRVLPVGGLKEKLLAAHRAGASTVVLPKRNSKDLRTIPKEIRKQLNLLFVETMDEVLKPVLVIPEADA
jgi:ATP-dependent Lon protease